MRSRPLLSLEHTQKGKIVKVRGKTDVYRRLHQLGLVIGATIEMNDADSNTGSVRIIVNRSMLLIDRELAANVSVEA